MKEPQLHRDLKGQVALVSGATRGIGARITVKLCELGATVYAGARDLADLKGADKEFEGRLRPVQLDVTDEDFVIDAMRLVMTGRLPDDKKAKWLTPGRLDILINNAGVIDRRTSLGTMEAAEFDRVMNTNLRGAWMLSREAIPHLLQRPGGRIINISSAMGALTGGMGGGNPAYRVSKAALNGLTAALDGEYGHRGLMVQSACPGWCATDMGGADAPRTADQGADTPVWLACFKPGSPAGRFWEDRAEIAW